VYAEIETDSCETIESATVPADYCWSRLEEYHQRVTLRVTFVGQVMVGLSNELGQQSSSQSKVQDDLYPVPTT